MSDPRYPRILITGVHGQVGFELVRSMQGLGEIVALTREHLDLRTAAQIRAILRRWHPSLIINAAAYTAVDSAESESELAYQINNTAVEVLANEAAALRAPLIHYSTDYVFNGEKQGLYFETDQPDPINVYGRSKLAGERAIAASGCAHIILRTSWVYGGQGANFVKTMLRLGATRDELRIVSDQLGAPTWSRTIADVTAHIVSGAAMVARTGPSESIQLESERWDEWWQARSGLYHFTGGGETNWAEFAEAIFKLKDIECRIQPILAADYATPARRPLNSRMSNEKFNKTFGLFSPDWRDALRLCLV